MKCLSENSMTHLLSDQKLESSRADHQKYVHLFNFFGAVEP